LARPGEDALGGGVQHPLGPGLEGGAEDVDRAEVIDRAEAAARLGPQVGVGGQVVDVPAAGDGALDRGAVADVAAHHLHRSGEVSRADPGQFQHADALAAGGEEVNQVTADEPGSAGDEDHGRTTDEEEFLTTEYTEYTE